MIEPVDQPFDESLLKRIVGTQQGDQFDETLRGMAKGMATYYRSLMESGLPQQMAEEMTLDYHWLFTGSLMFKNGGLPPRSY